MGLTEYQKKIHSALTQDQEWETICPELPRSAIRDTHTRLVQDREGPFRILDIGAGLGQTITEIAQKWSCYFGREIEAYGLDLGVPEGYKCEVTLVQGDVENMPFPDEYFDFIYSHRTLKLTRDTLQSLTEIYRTLKIGANAGLDLPQVDIAHAPSWEEIASNTRGADVFCYQDHKRLHVKKRDGDLFRGFPYELTDVLKGTEIPESEGRISWNYRQRAIYCSKS